MSSAGSVDGGPDTDSTKCFVDGFGLGGGGFAATSRTLSKIAVCSSVVFARGASSSSDTDSLSLLGLLFAVPFLARSSSSLRMRSARAS